MKAIDECLDAYQFNIEASYESDDDMSIPELILPTEEELESDNNDDEDDNTVTFLPPLLEHEAFDYDTKAPIFIPIDLKAN